MILKHWLRQVFQHLQDRTTRASLARHRRRSPAVSGQALNFLEFIVSPVVEALEDRSLLSHDSLLVEAIRIREPGESALLEMPESQIAAFQFSDNQRWSTTFTDGSLLAQGDATTLRWGIVPDGAAISGAAGEPATGSSLIQFFDSLSYGDGGIADDGDLTLKPWFFLFQDSLTRLSQISGLTYTYLAINSLSSGSVSIPNTSTSSATIPEILIGGHFIDGQSGSNTLAYNYFPNTSGGDMVIDTGNTNFFGTTTNSSRGARNVVMHEAGHGVGIDHVESGANPQTDEGSFLMEPFINTGFDGPQFDDILAFQRGYGDSLEKSGGNNTSGTATSLGTISSGSTVSRGTSAGSSTSVSASATDFISIDDNSDLDFFSFTVGAAGTTTLTLTPKGPTYFQGAQGGAQSQFIAASQSDLTLQLIGTDGTTVLQTVNATGLGGIETITNATLSAAGTYFVRVSGAADAIQLYQLDTSYNIASSTISASTNSSNGTADAFRFVRNGANLQVFIDNNLSQSMTFDSIASLTLQGSSDDDTLTLDFSGGNPIPSGGIFYAGGGQTSSDQIVLSGGTTTSVTHAFTNANDGSVTLAGALAGTISYTGLEPVIDNLSATNRVFTFNNGPETITLTDATGANMTIDSDVGGESVTFANPTASLTINAGSGDDIVTIVSVDAAFNVDLTINGDADADTVNLNADLITFASGDILAVNAETVTVGASADFVTSGAGTISLTADDVAINSTATLVSAATVTLKPQTTSRAINLGTDTAGQLSLTDAELDRVTAGTLQIGDTSSGTITVSAAVTRTASTNVNLTAGGHGNLSFSGAGSLDANGGDIIVSLNAAGTGGVVSGTATTDLLGDDLVITPGSAGIGSSGNPLTTSVSNLETVASAGGAFFSNAGGLTIGGISATVGVSVTGGDISVSASGPLTVSETVVNSGGGNVTLSTVGTRALTFVEFEDDGVGGVDGLDGASGVAISPDGNHVYVASSTDDSLAVFSRNAGTGALTFVEFKKDGVGGVDGLNGATGVTISPDGNHVYVASNQDDSVAVFSRNSGTGVLTFVEFEDDGVGGVDGLDGATGVTISPDGSHVYVASSTDDSLAVFSRNAGTGALTFVEFKDDGVGGVTTLDAANAVAISPTGSHVYVTAANDAAVTTFSRNSTTGVLTLVESDVDNAGGVDGLSGAAGVVVSPDGSHVYVTGSLDDSLAVFVRNTSTGALTFLEFKDDGAAGVNGLDGATGVTISADGNHVYVASLVDDSVAAFSRNSSTGVLTFLSFEDDGVDGVDGLDGATGIAVSPNGGHVYVASQTDSSAVVFARNAGAAAAIADDLTLSANVTASGGNGTITLNSVSDILQTTGTVSAVGTGFVDLNAGTDTSDGLITMGSAASISSVSGAITLDADGTVTTDVITSTSGSLAITAFDVVLNDALTSSGALTLAPVIVSSTIGIGGAAGTFALSDTELTRLANGFSSITIGAVLTGSGVVDIASSTFNDPLTIVGGLIVVTELVASGNAVTLTALSGAITDGGTTEADVTASGLIASATAGVGAVGNVLDTVVSNLEAAGGTGGVFVSNSGGLTIGGISAVVGVSATGGNIVVSASSPLTVNEDVINSGGGNVTLTSAGPVFGAVSLVEVELDGAGGVDGLAGALDVTLSPDGNHVYVVSGNDDAVAVFSRNATTGAVTFVEVKKDTDIGVDGLNGATDVALSPDGAHVYVASAADNAVSVFSRNATTGALTFVEVEKDGVNGVDGLNGAPGVAVSPDGAHVYVTSENDDAVAVFSRNATTGALTFVEFKQDGVGGVDGLNGAFGVTVSPDGSHVYVAGGVDDAVAVFSRNATTGALTFVEIEKDGVNSVDGLDGVKGVTLSADGSHVYVASNLDDSIAVFSRNAATGALTFVEFEDDNANGVNGLDGAVKVTVSSDGRHVYASAGTDDALTVFSRNSTTGALTFVEVERDAVGGVNGLDGASGVVVSPDGNHVYTSASNDFALAAFLRNSATVAASTDDLTLNANVTASGGNGTITLNGANDILQTAGTVLAAGTGTIALNAGTETLNSVITLSAGTTIGSAGSLGAITLTADDFGINSTATIASTSTVTLLSRTASQAINLGTDTAGQLSLTDAELDRVTAGTLQIGTSTSTNTIDVTSAIDLTEGPSIATTNLIAVGGVLGSGGNVLKTNALSVTAIGGIGVSGDAFSFDATTLTTNSNGTAINAQFLSESNSVTIAAADLDAGTTAITLSGGTFLTNSTGSILSTVTVASGATLGGTGTTGTGATGAVTVQSGGHVAPGTSPGILNSGNVSFASGSFFDVEINGTAGAGLASGHDQLNVTGSVTLNDGNLVVTLGYTPANGASFTIVANDSNDAVMGLGTFKVGGVSIADGGSFTVGSTTFVIDYTSGSNSNDVTLTVQNPPSSTWVEVGPAPTQDGQLESGTQPNRQVTGAIHTVLAHPTNANVLYIGTVNGGIWKTTNATATNPTWSAQTDNQATLSIGAMAFDPTDVTHNTLVAGTARYSSFAGAGGSRGNILRTTNGGATWTDPGSSGLAGENISGIAARGSTIVVSSSQNSGGLFRSTDGGVNFTEISSGGLDANDNVTDLVVDESDVTGMRLFASVEDEGIFRSTDFGATWTLISGAGNNATLNTLITATDVDGNGNDNNNIEMTVHPTSGRLFVAVLNRSQPAGIFYSDNASAGTPTWTQMDLPILPIGTGIAISSVTGNGVSPIVITSVGHGLDAGDNNSVLITGVTGNTAANGQFRVTVLTADTFRLDGTTGNGNYTGGGTWTRITGASPRAKDFDSETGAQGGTHFSIRVDLGNANILYVGGDRQEQPNSIGDNTFGGAIFRGDASITRDPTVAPSPQWDHLTHDVVAFDPAGGTANGSAPHADSREMVVDAAGNLIEVDDGGIYKRTSPLNNTGDWFSLAGNLGVVEFHDIAYNTISNTIVGGTQDNGTHLQLAFGNSVFTLINGGDGGDVLVDHQTLAGSSQAIIYYSSQNLGGFTRATYDSSNNEVSSVSIGLNSGSDPAFSAQFDTPLALNNIDATRLLLGGTNGLYESTNQGDTITRVSATIITEDITFPSSLGALGVNAIDYGGRLAMVDNEDVAYVGDNAGNIHVRTTLAGGFTSTSPGGSVILDVRMDPETYTTAFAVDQDQVFQTTNTGSAWSDITGNLSTLGASVFRSIEYIAGALDAIVVGTNTGVFASLTTSLGTWFELASDLPNVPVFELVHDATDDVLIAGTMGRGAWLLENVQFALSGLTGTTNVSLVGNDLTIADATVGGAPDNLTIQSDTANTQFIISDPDNILTTAIAGATGNGTHTLTIPFGSISGIVINTLDQSDSVTVDFTPGNFAVAIAYAGGNPTNGPGDSLTLIGGGTFTNLTVTMTGADSGTIDVTGNSTITFSGLEPVSSSITATNVTLNYTSTAETLTVSAFGVGGQTQVTSSVSEDVYFNSPSGTLTINAGVTNDDTVNINSLGSGFAGSLTVDGEGGADVINLNTDLAFTGGSVSLNGQMLDINNSISTTGSGSISLIATEQIDISSGLSFETVDGNLTMIVNEAEAAIAADYIGLYLNNVTVRSQNGDILLRGKGGDTGSFNIGVELIGTTLVESTGTGANAGSITIIGRGGNGTTSNYGVSLTTSTVILQSVDGDIQVTGTGGNTSTASSFNRGISFTAGTVRSTGTSADAATITFTGTGGNGTGSDRGIELTGSSVLLTSVAGAIQLTGQGGSGSGANFNYGVSLSSGADITSTGVGAGAATITIQGTGGAGVEQNEGVLIEDSGTLVTSVAGAIQITGTSQGTTILNRGVVVQDAAQITSTGTAAPAATITINGTGGAGTSSNRGLQLSGTNTLVTSVVGAISLTGTGGNGSGSSNYGVLVDTGAKISSTGTSTGAATITINGTGGVGPSTNRGVNIVDAATLITSVVGNIAITGTGGGNGTAASNRGLYLQGGTVSSTGTGANAAQITLTGTGGTGTAFDRGIELVGSTVLVTSVAGAISLNGTGGGGSSTSKEGVNINTSAVVSSTGSSPAASITITGVAIASASNGVTVNTASVNAGSGSLTIATNTLDISAATAIQGTNTLTIQPTTSSTTIGIGGGSGTLSLNDIELGKFTNGFSSITIGDATNGTGAVDVDSSTFNDPVTIVGGSITVGDAAAAGLDAGTNAVTLTARTGAIIDGGDGGTDVIGGAVALNAANGTIGASSNAISLAATSLTTSTATSNGAQFLTETDSVTWNSSSAGSGTIDLDGGTFLIASSQTITGAVDVNSGATLGGTGSVSGTVTVASNGHIAPGTSPGILNSGNVSFASGSFFDVEIGGVDAGSANNNHDQLNVTGTVSLNNATLNLSAVNGYLPTGGEQFTILVKGGGVAIPDTFNGLVDGATISNFLNSGLDATISYNSSADGNDGNDIVLTVESTASETTVAVSGGNLILTDDNGGTSNDTLTIARSGTNVRISDPNNSLSAGAGAMQVNANTVDVPLASITGNIQFAALAGNDTLTVDFSGGNPIPSGGISFAGGTQTTLDQIVLIGGTTTTVTHSFTNANDGSITLAGTLAGTISYTGLEPVTDNLNATDRVFSFTGGAETITVTDHATAGLTSIDSTLGEIVHFANPTGSLTINAGTGADIVTVTSVDAAYNVDLTINGDAGSDTVNLNGDITFASGESLNVNLTNDASGGDLDSVTVGASANLITSGSGSIALQSSGTITAAAGSSLETVNGGITVAANSAGAASGNFVGVTLTGTTVSTSGTGNISVTGIGVVTGSGGHGVRVQSSSIVQSTASGATAGTVTINGSIQGGTSLVRGVILGSSALVTSVSGAISVTGQGSTTATTDSNIGLQIAGGADVTSTGTGANAATITLNGTGGSGTGGHIGFHLSNAVSAGASVTTVDGAVHITGQGGSSATGGGQAGVLLTGDVFVESTGTGMLTITGTAGNGTGSDRGINIDTNALVRSTGSGDVLLVGTGNSDGTESSAFGILLYANSLVTTTGSGNVTLRGIGGTGSGDNDGISIGHLPLASPSSITSTSTGNVILQGKAGTGSNTYGIKLEATGSTISSSGTGTVTLAADGIVLSTGTTIAAGSNIVTLRPATTTDIATDDNGDTITIGNASGGDISGNSNALHVSDDELNLITAGRIVIGNASAGAVTLAGGIAAANSTTIEVITGSTINDAGAITFTETNVALNAAGGIGTTSSLDIQVTNLALTAATGGINVTHTGNVNLTTVGGVTGVSATTSGNVSIAATGSITVTQPVSTVGAGTLLLDAQSGDAGDIIVNNTVTTASGALTLRADDDLSSNSSGTLTTTSGVVTLTADDDGTTTGNITYAAAVNHGSAGSVWSLSETTGSASGVISGSGSFTKNGTGTLTLSGTSANTFTGTTTVNTGTLQFNKTAGLNAIGGHLTIGNGSATDTVKLLAANQIPNTTDVTIATGGVFDLNAQAETIDALTGTGSVTSSVAGAVTLTIGANNDTTPSFSGVISNGSGTVALTKSGSGTQTLAGANTYTGATTISAGRLNVNGSTASGSAVTVQNTGTLGGTGTVAGTVSVQSGGTVSPGLSLSAGLLNSGSATFVSSSMFVAEINGSTTAGTDYDQLNVTGTVDLGGATLSTSGTITSSPGQQVTIINKVVGGAITNTFAGLAEGATVTVNSISFVITYVGGDGNDVVLSQTEVSVVVSPASVTENGATNLDYTFTRSGATGAPLTVSFTVSGSAVFDTDYTQTGAATFGTSSGTVTFLAGSSTAIITLDPSDDSTVEAAETAVLTVTSGAGYAVGAPSLATGTITDNDTATFTIDDLTKNETDGTLTFTVSLSNPIDTTATLNVSFADVSTSAGDFAHTTQQVTFAANSTTAQQVTVAITNDSMVEVTETFTASLALDGTTPLTGRSSNLSDTGTGTITDNDTATVTIADVTKSETDGSMTFTVSLSNPIDTIAKVNVSFADVTTSAGDFDHTTQQVTFAANTTTAQLVVVSINNDIDPESTETFTASLALDGSTPLTGRASNLADTGTGTITDNDNSTPTLSINDVSVTEGNSGTTTLNFTVTLSAATSTGFTVQFVTQDGTATVASNDYLPILASGNLRIGSFDGSRGGLFSLSDGASAAAMRSAIQTNFAGTTFSGTSTLTAAFLANVDVLWLNSVSSSTSTTAALSAAEQSALLNFVNNGGGVLIFGESDFFDDESLLDPFGATSTGTLVELQTGTITNVAHPVTNGPFGAVQTIRGNYPGNLTTLGPATSLGTWNSGGQSSLAVIDPGALTPGSGRVVLFSDVNFYSDQLNTADNSKLLLNALKSAQPSNRLTFAGTAGETKSISVTVNGDTQIEPSETLSVLLSNIAGNNEVTIADGTGVGTITNDDAATPPVITSNGGGNTANINVAENTAAVTTVTATDPGDTLTFSITGGADFAKFTIHPTTGVLSFLSAPDFEAPTDQNTNNVYEVTVTVTDSSSQTDSQALSVTVTNVVNETATLTINDAMVTEGNSGTTTLNFTVTLSAATSTGFTVQFLTQDGTATVADNDYVPILANGNLRIGSFDGSRGGLFSLSDGASSAAMRSAIQTNFAGSTFMGTSTLTAAFLANVDVLWLNSVSSSTSATAALSAAEQSALLNFVNNGGGVLIFGESDFFDDESLLDPFGATSTGTLFELQTGTITNVAHPVTNGPFGAVQTIRGNYPGNLTTLGPATSLGTWNSGGQSSLAVIDPGALTPGSGRVVLFSDVNFYSDQLNTADNSKLLLNALKSAQPSNRLTFAGTAAGETKSISVTVNGDTQAESHETLSVLLSNIAGNNEVTISDATGVGTITNDDAAPAAPVVNDQNFSINENSANNSVVGTVIATDPGDVLTYSIMSGNTGGAFAINSSTGQLTVANSAVLDFETTPSFPLTVKVQDAGGLSDTATITINLNNLQATLSINDVSQNEGNSGTSPMTFNVTLSSATGAAFTVPFNSLDGSATTANNDYVALSSNATLKVGAFNSARGGDFSLSNGSSVAAMKAAILANFPGATIVGTNNLDAAFLATVNVVWLNSVSASTTAISPLTLAEQTALLNFVNAGGGAIVFGEHNFFNDTSLLSPFNLATDSSNDGVVVGTITNPAHPVTAGPFGNVTTILSNFSGNLTSLGGATSLGTWNSSGLSALAVLNSGAGHVVALTDVNLYSDQLAAADNQKMLLNAVAFAKPVSSLQFVGTALEVQTISVTINGDGTVEPNETFNVLLTGITGSNDVTILDNTGIGTIVNDDAADILQISDTLVSERPKQAANATFTVTLSSPSPQPVTVNFSTTRVPDNGVSDIGAAPTATVGKDFKATTGTLRFAPGQMSQTITVPVLDDALHEGDETFFVQLSAATGATIANGVAQATIRDNDAAPRLSISDVSVTEKTNTATAAKFTVKLSSASAVPVTVDFATAAASAIEGTDYQATRGTLTFNPGETSKTITVLTNDDSLHEAGETFFVNLSNSMQAAIVDRQGKGTIKDNDKAPKLSIGDVTVIEGTTAEFTVSLSAPSGQAVTVNYATANGTALAGRDFTAITGTLTFAPGETSKTIRVAIAQDVIATSNKSLKLILSRAVNALFADSQALATILDSGN